MPPRAPGLLVILALDLLVAPLAATPPSGKIPLIGVLRPVAADDPHTEAFRQGLRELGYVEGHNVQTSTKFSLRIWLVKSTLGRGTSRQATLSGFLGWGQRLRSLGLRSNGSRQVPGVNSGHTAGVSPAVHRARKAKVMIRHVGCSQTCPFCASERSRHEGARS